MRPEAHDHGVRTVFPRLGQTGTSQEIIDFLPARSAEMPLLSSLFGGALLTNAIPHLVSGMRWRSFQSPFARPPGKDKGDAAAFGPGVLLTALLLARMFGRFHGSWTGFRSDRAPGSGHPAAYE